MHWFDETQQMGWLVIFWIVSAVVLTAGSWVMTLRRSGKRGGRAQPAPMTHGVPQHGSS